MTDTAERPVRPDTRQTDAFRTKEIAFVGVFGAVAAVLMYFEFPLPFLPGFYQLDFSEVPVLIGTFAFGPVAGTLIELVKILLHLLLKGTSTAFVGDFANFLIGFALLLPAGLIYQNRKTRRRALAGMAAGTACMTVCGAVMNLYFLIPAYAKAFGLSVDAIVAMGTQVNPAVTSLNGLVLLCNVPFNLLKGVLVSAATFLLYKHVSRFIHKAGE